MLKFVRRGALCACHLRNKCTNECVYVFKYVNMSVYMFLIDVCSLHDNSDSMKRN